jgi:hypothetical protein
VDAGAPEGLRRLTQGFAAGRRRSAGAAIRARRGGGQATG